MHELYFLLLLLASSGNSILILILLRKTGDSPVLRTFVILLLLINAWSIPQLLLVTYHFTGDVFIAIDKVSAFGYVFIPVAISLFALAYTGTLRTARNISHILGIYVPAIIFLYLAWNTNLIETRIYQEIKPTSWGYTVPTGILFPLMVIWFEFVSLYAIFIIWQMSHRTLDPVRKKQSWLLMIALATPIIFGTMTNGILPALHVAVFPVAIPLTTITAIVITYAIYKYGLFEISTQTVLSSIGNGVITINTQKKILLINKVAKELLGLHRNVYEKSLDDIVTIRRGQQNKHSFKEKNPIASVLRTGTQIKSHDFVMKSKNNRTFSAECTISPLIQNHSVVGVTIVFRDNSQEKAIEKSKNEFIGIASHELKTPLTSVIAFSQLLERDIAKTDNKQHAYIIKSINEQLHKMKSLIEDLLNVSRIENGMFTLNKTLQPIDQIITKTVKDLQYSCDTHHLQKVGTTNKKLFVDAERIQQVLVNLISNAIKYAPDTKKIIIRVQETKDSLIISVQDFGIGITKKDQEKIFERFYRSNKHHPTSMSGFGLGLYICAEIIRNHKGKIWVDSKPKKGATFSFSLPYGRH